MSWVVKNTLNWLQLFAIKVLRAGHIPKHVAIIMDGNRRYARKIGCERIVGHSKGFDKLTEVLQWGCEFGFLEVTVYAFSIDNFNRTQNEVDSIMNLAKERLQKIIDEKDKMMENGICIRVIGDLSLIRVDVLKVILQAIAITKDNNKLFVNIAFSYSSRHEVVNAAKDVIDGVVRGDIEIDDIDENLMTKCLYTYKSSDPDLLLRTSGETRLSDFLMWQTSFTYVYFTKVLWPEFNAWQLIFAVFYYQRCYGYLKQAKSEIVNNTMLSVKCREFVDKLHRDRENTLLRQANEAHF